MQPNTNELARLEREGVEVVDVTVAGLILGVGHSSLAQWRAKSSGPPFTKVKGRILYRLEDVKAFLRGEDVFANTTHARMVKLDKAARAEKAANQAEKKSKRKGKAA